MLVREWDEAQFGVGWAGFEFRNVGLGRGGGEIREILAGGLPRDRDIGS